MLKAILFGNISVVYKETSNHTAIYMSDEIVSKTVIFSALISCNPMRQSNVKQIVTQKNKILK